MISEKNILQSDFEGKNLTRKYLGEMISYNEKIYFMAYTPGKKSYSVVCRGEKFYHQMFGEKHFSPKQNHPYPPQTSNGRPLISALTSQMCLLLFLRTLYHLAHTRDYLALLEGRTSDIHLQCLFPSSASEMRSCLDQA